MMKSWCSVPYRGREREYWRGRKRSKREKDKTLVYYYDRKRWVFINPELHDHV